MIQKNTKKAAQRAKVSVNALGCPPSWASAVSAVLIATATCSGAEPTYGGRTLTEWANDARPTEAWHKRGQARDAISQIGTNALPFLLSEIVSANELFEQVGQAKFRTSRENIHREFIIRSALEALGSAAKPVAPALAQMVNDGKDPAWFAAHALAQVDPKTAAEVFTKQLNSPSLDVRIGAADCLRTVGTNALIAVPALIRCLKDESANRSWSISLKVGAMGALQKSGSRSEQVVKALSECLKDREEVVRGAAATVLASFGEEARLAFPALQQLSTNDPSSSVRTQAGHAINRLTPR